MLLNTLCLILVANPNPKQLCLTLGLKEMNDAT